MVKLVGDSAQLGRVFGQTRETIAQLQRLQIQVATGEKARNYKEIADDASRLLLTENNFKEIKQYMRNIDEVRFEADTLDTAMKNITDLATEFRALLVNATSADNYTQYDVSGIANDLLTRLTTMLNTRADGKYIFAGTMTDTRPVVQPTPLTPPSNNGGAGGTFIPFDKTTLDPVLNPTEWAEYFGYYQGNDKVQQIRTDEAQVIEWGITANHDGINDLVYAMRLAATFEDPLVAGEERSRLDTALNIVNDAIGKIVDRHSQLGLQLKEMDRNYDEHANDIIALEDIIVDIEATNITEAVSQISGLENTIQASYLTISRLQNVSLLNFLR